MSNNSQKVLSLINARIAAVERQQNNDLANPNLTQRDRELSANYYRGALNALHLLRNQVDSEMTWRDRA